MLKFKTFLPVFFIFFTTLFTIHCTGSDGIGMFAKPDQVAVDSTNDRLFLTQPRQELFALTASSKEGIGDQPLVSEESNADIYNILPYVVTHFEVYASGSISRLFVMGAFQNDAGNTVLNRLLVLDFDGSTFSEAGFSPLDLSDGDDTTDETDNSFADVLVDEDGGRLFVTDAGAGLLYVLSATDGSTVVGPIAIAGNPQGMGLAGDRLYVCNSSETEGETLITVVNLTDFSTTAIDAGVPCSEISVQDNDSGAVMVLKHSDSQMVLIRSVDTTTFADSSAIAASTEGFAAGQLSSGLGITSDIADIVLTRDSSGTVYGYLSELDGNIQVLTIASDLSSYSLETLSTTVLNITKGAVLTDSSGLGSQVFFAGRGGALILIDVGSTTVDVDD